MTNPIDLSFSGRRTTRSDADRPESSEDLPGIDEESVARAARDAAWIRYEAFTSSTPKELSFNCDRRTPQFDFDNCGTVRIRDPILFHAEGTAVPLAAMTDIQQKQVGDCSFMAVLAGLAAREDGRALLRSLIAENKDKNGTVVSYTVTLHAGFLPSLGLLPSLLLLRNKKTQVTVPAEYPKGHSAAVRDGDHRVVWPLVLERAFAQLRGGYDSIARGSSVEEAFATLTGDPGKWVPLSTTSYSVRDIQQDLAAGKLVIVQTRKELPPAEGLNFVARHAYLVTGVSGTPPSLNLYNPWGTVVSQVTDAALQRAFAAAVVGSVNGGSRQ